jgi:hypothetical protein
VSISNIRAAVKNVWGYTSISLYVFIAWRLIKAQEKRHILIFTDLQRAAYGCYSRVLYKHNLICPLRYLAELTAFEGYVYTYNKHDAGIIITVQNGPRPVMTRTSQKRNLRPVFTATKRITCYVVAGSAAQSMLIILNFCYENRDSDWLRAGRPRGRSSSPGRVKNFLFSASSRPDLGFTQTPIQWVPGAIFPGV